MQDENNIANALSKLASLSEPTRHIIQKIRTTSCLEVAEVVKIGTKELPGWIEEMIQYLEKKKLQQNLVEAKRVKRQAVEYLVLDWILYR